VFFGIVITAIIYSLLFFRQPQGDNTDALPVKGNTRLEVAWTIIPLIIVVILSNYGAKVLDKMTVVDPHVHTTQSMFSLGAMVPRNIEPSASANTTSPEFVVNVSAFRFGWQFEYPQYGITSFILEVPVNQRIRFNFTSGDVIHSFWVQQWGPKQDAVPGLSPSLYITPTEIGQLCGFGHTQMTAPVSVVSAADFDNWVKQQQSSTPPPPPPGTHVMINLIAKNIAFDKSTITVSAGAEVMIDFDNQDAGIPHNFAVYQSGSKASGTASGLIFAGQIITGPNKITYTFTAPTTPGNYFFRCDVHPTIMTGTFVVQ
jgi:heme/copper-type cytochrome/quinol oxidase subunit 2